MLKNKSLKKIIYIATPWGPVGGGMYKVADYLIQTQTISENNNVELRALDTRGNGHSIFSLFFIIRAIFVLIFSRLNKQLVGVHINIAERLSVVRKGVLILICKVLGVPVVLHLHAAQFPQFYGRLPRFLKSLIKYIFSLPKVCIVLGKSAKDFVEIDLKVPESKIEIVINGVPAPIIPRRFPNSKDFLNVLFLGNLSERKGVSDFLKALINVRCCCPSLSVTLAGGGDVEIYRKKTVEYRLDDLVKFEGWVDQQRAANLLANTDVLILPSYDEGLPLVILEALSNGVAVVCSPVGEIPNFLTDRLDVMFVKPGDVDGIATVLKDVLSNSDLRSRLEEQGKKTYTDKFSVTQFFDRISSTHQRCFGFSAKRNADFVSRVN